MIRSLAPAAAVCLLSTADAELRLPAIIGDHMVLQQQQSNPIWGWDDPGTEVTVTMGDQKKTATAGDDGKWEVKLDPLPASAEPATLAIAGTSKRDLADILVGEVWMCSGQSNMAFSVGGDWKAQVEALASDHPNLRLISVPQVGTQELQDDFNGKWEASTPESCRGFSAVGFFYGRFLHEILGVPVGLIDNAWGGSAAEAWIRRETMENDPRFARLIADWKSREAAYEADPEAKDAQKNLKGNHRPGNIFGGVVHPTLGYGIKGVIWYQGESNAGRAWEYGELFPFMIEQWRKEWGQGDFPFYWVQLADFRDEPSQPGDSQWAELRESQTGAMALPNTGEAVIIDLGEANDIHPKNKYDVAARLVRWPLANEYGFDNIEPHSPKFREMTTEGNKAKLSFDHVDGKLRTVDVNEVKGFAIAGEDRQWKWAEAKITGKDTIDVWSSEVEAPVAVRYGWAENPVVNVYSTNGLPLTPFRTDAFPMVTMPAE